jgi:hypothetical protein
MSSKLLTGRQPQNLPVLEAATSIGTVVTWKGKGEDETGVVIGAKGRDVLVTTTFDRTVGRGHSLQRYRDDVLTAAVPQPVGLPGIERDVHRIPRARLRVQGKVKGRERALYSRLARAMQRKRESVETMEHLKHLAGV